jgi:rhamnosyltransferase
MILIRDDGSNDSTFDIIEKYKAKYGNIEVKQEKNIGAGPSFLELIKYAAEDYPNFDYYAFSDQDDVWLENKLLTGVNALDNSTRNYKLFFSGSINSDNQLHAIASSSVSKVVNSFGANLVSNHILGCTMLFNKELLVEINKINTKPYTISSGKVPLHDGWTAFVAYALDADVIYHAEGLMYYRQHGNNVIGSGQGKKQIIINRFKRYMGNNNHVKANRCIIALQVLGEDIPEHNKQLLELVAYYKKNIKSKIKLIIDKRMYENSFIDNIGTFFMLIFNKF